MVLVQAPVAGGDLRVARQCGTEGVGWRAAGPDAMFVARRMRDTTSCRLHAAGQCALIDGCAYVHEVTRVSGSVPRVSLSLTLECP